MHLLVGHPEAFAHHLIGLAYHLHIAVFNAVMDHLYEVSCSVFADPFAAGVAFIGSCADSLENWLDVFPGLW